MRLAAWLLLIGLTYAPARADDRSDIARLFARRDRVDTLKSADGWAWVTVDYAGNGGGTYLVHRLDGHWRVLGGGGGALDVGDAARLGLPRRYWTSLLHYKPSAQDVERAEHQGPAWPETERRMLNATDLAGRSAWELTLMRNEIPARHGRAFKDAELRAYFGDKAWYHPDPAYSERRLTKTEAANAVFIASYQRQHHLDM